MNRFIFIPSCNVVYVTRSLKILTVDNANVGFAGLIQSCLAEMMLTFHTNFSVTPLRYLGFHGCLLSYSAFSRACLKCIVIRLFTEIFTKDSLVVVSCSIDIGREVCSGLRSAVKTIRFSNALKYAFRRNSKQIQRMHCIHVVKTSA